MIDRTQEISDAFGVRPEVGGGGYVVRLPDGVQVTIEPGEVFFVRVEQGDTWIGSFARDTIDEATADAVRFVEHMTGVEL
jgi:hypothetical protein